MRFLCDDYTIIAPDFVILETLNVIWRQFRRKEPTHAQASETESQLADYFDKLVPSSTLSVRALNIAIELDHSAYDCAYLACALTEGGPMISADDVFLEKADRAGYSSSILRLEQVASKPLLR
jgi:predicted nucleic acid-binding protein